MSQSPSSKPTGAVGHERMIQGEERLLRDGCLAALRRVKVYEVMSEEPLTITPGTGLREAALLMIENKIGGLPVVDEQGLVVGIVTESDLFEALVQQLDSSGGTGA